VASSKTPYEESILGTNLWWLKAVVRFVMAMVMFSAISIGVNLVYNKYVWATGTGPDHLESMIGFALDHRVNPAFAEKCSDLAYWLYFKWNLIDDTVMRYANGEPASTIIARKYRDILIIPFQNELAVAMYSAKLFGIRMAGLILALPLFCLTCSVAVVDGLTERYVRKMCIGNESSTIYHRAKFYAFKLIPPTAGLIYLTAPYSIEPVLIFVPTALLTGLLLRTQMKFYKKHL
jgi:integrating conjugative element membrane protein (TIGR03747 family)